MTRILASCLILWLPALAGSAPQRDTDPLHRPLDQILDVNVRDGMVYYRALKAERGRLDRYISSLNVPPATYAAMSREQQIALWLNAYNAIVLQTVISHYPIAGTSKAYPSKSIRQIPGAFERTRHRIAGRSVTLDEIDKTILPEFKDPRLHLAIGRGAVGSGRLRSEAYVAERLAEQLDTVVNDFMSHREMLKIDRGAGTISVTPILSWFEKAFVAAYDKGADGKFGQRSPIERALITFISPKLLTLEREFVDKNEFRVVFHQMDWRLNDLTGGRID